MRYVTRWSNGYWCIFDTHLYTKVLSVATMLEANKGCQIANNLKRK